VIQCELLCDVVSVRFDQDQDCALFMPGSAEVLLCQFSDWQCVFDRVKLKSAAAAMCPEDEARFKLQSVLERLGANFR
jgi:hypothetical protein